MGNKQKSKKISKEEKNSKNIICYLLCPKCWKKIPYLNTFIDGNNIKIKILCSCIENNNYYIMDLEEYINLITYRKGSIQCINHSEIESKNFCMNCESWLCTNCFSNHSKDVCKLEYNNNEKEKEKKNICFTHYNKKYIFVNSVKIFFVKNAFCCIISKIKKSIEERILSII